MHSTPDLWVLSCAPGSRAAEAGELFSSLGTPEDRRVLVTTEPDPVLDFPGHLLRYPATDINISKWWTLGLNHIASHYGPDDIWDVLLIETDARITPQAVDTLRDHMRVLDTVMAGADWHHVLGDQSYKVRRDNAAWGGFENRIPGIAAVISGETGIRHDPEFRWWLADDDFEWQHRVNGGTVLVGGLEIQHVGTQGPLTGERLKAWEEDQGKFLAKWGGLPVTGGVLPSAEVQRVTHEVTGKSLL